MFRLEFTSNTGLQAGQIENLYSISCTKTLVPIMESLSPSTHDVSMTWTAERKDDHHRLHWPVVADIPTHQ